MPTIAPGQLLEREIAEDNVAIAAPVPAPFEDDVDELSDLDLEQRANAHRIV